MVMDEKVLVFRYEANEANTEKFHKILKEFKLFTQIYESSPDAVDQSEPETTRLPASPYKKRNRKVTWPSEKSPTKSNNGASVSSNPSKITNVENSPTNSKEKIPVSTDQHNIHGSLFEPTASGEQAVDVDYVCLLRQSKNTENYLNDKIMALASSAIEAELGTADRFFAFEPAMFGNILDSPASQHKRIYGAFGLQKVKKVVRPLFHDQHSFELWGAMCHKQHWSGLYVSVCGYTFTITCWIIDSVRQDDQEVPVDIQATCKEFLELLLGNYNELYTLKFARIVPYQQNNSWSCGYHVLNCYRTILNCSIRSNGRQHGTIEYSYRTSSRCLNLEMVLGSNHLSHEKVYLLLLLKLPLENFGFTGPIMKFIRENYADMLPPIVS